MAELNIRTSRVITGVVVFALVAELLILVLDIVFNLVDVTGDRSIQRLVNPARETSIPTWFASTQAVVVGTVAAVTAWVTAQSQGVRRAAPWAFVAAFFIYIGADDASEIHEGISSAIVRAAGDESSLATLPTYAWQALIGPFLALGLLTSAAIIGWAGSMRVRVIVFAGLGCFALSQGLDVLEGMPENEAWLEAYATAHDYPKYNLTHIPRLIEECLEMLATTCFLAASLLVLRTRLTGRVVSFDAPVLDLVDEDAPTEPGVDASTD
jgi:hypothetical protein